MRSTLREDGRLWFTSKSGGFASSSRHRDSQDRAAGRFLSWPLRHFALEVRELLFARRLTVRRRTFSTFMLLGQDQDSEIALGTSTAGFQLAGSVLRPGW